VFNRLAPFLFLEPFSMPDVIACLECGNEASKGHQPEKLFCCATCRLAFNNRRRDRGADLYDLFRALRRERSEAKRLNIWTQICRLELAWQMADQEARPGRRSYIPPKKALANLFDKGSLQRGDIIASQMRAGR
jgi:hypothetical protein